MTFGPFLTHPLAGQAEDLTGEWWLRTPLNPRVVKRIYQLSRVVEREPWELSPNAPSIPPLSSVQTVQARQKLPSTPWVPASLARYHCLPVLKSCFLCSPWETAVGRWLR